MKFKDLQKLDDADLDSAGAQLNIKRKPHARTDDGLPVQVKKIDELVAALEAAGLTDDDEVVVCRAGKITSVHVD